MLIHPLRVVDIWVTVNNLPLGFPFERKTEITKIYLSFVFVTLQNILYSYFKRKIIKKKFWNNKDHTKSHHTSDLYHPRAFIEINHSKYSVMVMHLNHVFNEGGDKHIVKFHVFIFEDIL